MCLAVPVKVIELLSGNMAKVQVGKSETYLEVSTLLLPQVASPGDYLIVHAGFALRALDPAEAEESLELYRQIAAQEGLAADF